MNCALLTDEDASIRMKMLGRKLKQTHYLHEDANILAHSVRTGGTAKTMAWLS